MSREFEPTVVSQSNERHSRLVVKFEAVAASTTPKRAPQNHTTPMTGWRIVADPVERRQKMGFFLVDSLLVPCCHPPLAGPTPGPGHSPNDWLWRGWPDAWSSQRARRKKKIQPSGAPLRRNFFLPLLPQLPQTNHPRHISNAHSWFCLFSRISRAQELDEVTFNSATLAAPA